MFMQELSGTRKARRHYDVPSARTKVECAKPARHSLADMLPVLRGIAFASTPSFTAYLIPTCTKRLFCTIESNTAADNPT